MRKLYLILLGCLLILISGCTNLTDSDPKLVKVDTLITKFNLDESNGFDYSVIQQDDNQVTLNQLLVEQRIDRTSDIKIYTEFSAMNLLPFNLEQTHETENYVIYYYQNEKGTQIGEGSVIWEATTLESYQTIKLPVVRIRKDDFKTYNVSESNDIATLTAVIEINRIESLTGLKLTGIQSMNLEIQYQISTNRLISVKLEYSQVSSNTVMTFTPYYGSAEVVLPTR